MDIVKNVLAQNGWFLFIIRFDFLNNFNYGVTGGERVGWEEEAGLINQRYFYMILCNWKIRGMGDGETTLNFKREEVNGIGIKVTKGVR